MNEREQLHPSEPAGHRDRRALSVVPTWSKLEAAADLRRAAGLPAAEPPSAPSAKALSIRQPWAYAICHLSKRVENRAWKHPPSYRGPLLIHASAGRGLGSDWESALISALVAAGPGAAIDLDGMSFGALVARAVLSAVVENRENGHGFATGPGGVKDGSKCRNCTAVVGVGRAWGGRCPSPDRWAVPGQLGFILSDVELLPRPIPYRGALGLFDVPDELFAPSAEDDGR
jgi:hypothetical protein